MSEGAEDCNNNNTTNNTFHAEAQGRRELGAPEPSVVPAAGIAAAAGSYFVIGWLLLHAARRLADFENIVARRISDRTGNQP